MSPTPLGRHRLEGAVTLAQQHPDRAVVVADGDQVGPAVAVDVGHDGLDRRSVGGEGLLRAERSRRRCSAGRSRCCRRSWW